MSKCPRCEAPVKVSVNHIIGPHKDGCKQTCWATGRTVSEVQVAIERDRAKLREMYAEAVLPRVLRPA